MADSAGHILIVEDEPGIAEVLGDLLGDEGYETVLSVDGGALATAADDPPALILLDVMMPRMDGPEVCRRLKADLRTARVLVIFLTALPPHTLAARLGDAPHDGVILKPFTLDGVLAVVRHHLG